MTQRLLLIVLVALTLHAQQAGSVQGTVLNSADRQPVAKAAVTITSMAQDRSYAVAITDSTGRFTLPGIPAGKYFLIAARNNYSGVAYGAAKPQHRGTALALAPGEMRTGIELQLVPVTAVSGTATDAEGDVLPGVSIMLYQKRFDRGKPRFFGVAGGGTDQRGHYEIAVMQPGEYYALAQAHGRPVYRTRPVTIAGEQLPQETAGNQYFPGVDRLSDASPVIVVPGRDTTGIDFHLAYFPQVMVHGQITGIPEGTANVSLGIELDSAVFGNGMTFAQIDPKTGIFQAQGIPSGTYRITARAGARRATTTAQLTGADNQVNLTLLPGSTVRGTLTVEGPNASALKDAQVNLTPGDYSFMPTPVRAPVKNGAFQFTEVPAGIWDIGVNPLPRGSYIKSMHLGKQDVLLEEMVIDANTKGSLDIVISTSAPKVEGTVDPAAPATVLAAPTGKLSEIFSFYSTTQTDEKGHFTFYGLNPGAYRFYAFHELDDQAWQDSKFLPPFEAQSHLVDLKEGATESVKLAVIGAAH